MSKPEQFTPRQEQGDPFEQQREIFKKHFPDGSIEIIALEDIPPDALETLEGRSRLLVLPENYRPGNFKKLFVVAHAAGDRTFVAQQLKTYGATGDTEELTYLADVDDHGELAGYGEIRLNISNNDPYFKDKPSVGFTRTEAERQKRGFGERRIRLMNALTRMLYDLPLHSDTLMTPEAKRLWEKLAGNGEARKYLEGKNERFAFSD